MTAYLDPIKMALVTFPIVSIFLTVPFAIYNYRKYGYINKWRTFVLFSFLLFMISAYYLVIMPLPSSRDVKSSQSPDIEHWNLRPFQFIRDIKRESRVEIGRPDTYTRIFRERAFLQAAFNVLLLFPLGVYLRYYFGRNFRQTVFIGFLVSLFFELTQLTGLYGIYNAPYRIFDVDDLLLNTLGASLGYGISPVFSYFLPRTEELDERAGSKKYKVGYIRRLIAFGIIDVWLVRVIGGIFRATRIQRGLIFIGYFSLLPLLTGGKTLGYALTNMKLMGSREKLRFRDSFLRSTSFYLVFYGTRQVLQEINQINMSGKYGQYLIYFYLIIFAFYLLLLAHCLYSLIKRERFFYERISKTYLKVDKVAD